MEYGAIANALRSKCSELEAFVNDVKGISFDTVWSGNAHDFMITSLNDLIMRTQVEITNIRIYADALDYLQRYKNYQEKLTQYKAQYDSTPDIEENKNKRINLMSLINTLNGASGESIKVISNKLSSFAAIDSEIEVVTYDPSVEDYGQFIVDSDSIVDSGDNVVTDNSNDKTTNDTDKPLVESDTKDDTTTDKDATEKPSDTALKDYGDFIVDVDDLLAAYSSKSDDPLKILNGGSLYDYYNSYDENGNVIEGSGKAYVEGLILDIRNKYSGRDAAVNSALAILQLAADKGIKIDYEHKGTAGIRPYVRTTDVASGVDCNPFVSWCVDKGVDTGFQWRPVQNFQKVGTEIKRDDWGTAKPGDLLSSEGHIIIIVENDPEREVFTVAHAAGTNVGIVLEEKPYSKMGKYSLRDMTEVYNGEENTDRWNSFSKYVDPNTFERNLV